MITCPHCGHQQAVIEPQEGTRPVLCHECLRMFDYVCEDGHVRNWHAPKIAGIIYKGAGDAGGS